MWNPLARCDTDHRSTIAPRFRLRARLHRVARGRRRAWIGALGLVVGFATANAPVTRASESADRPLKRSATATYQVDFRAIVTPRKGTKVLRVWLPLAQTDEFQTVGKRSLSTLPRQVEPVVGRESTFGNQFAYFEFADPTGAVMITHQFEATTSQFDWDVRLDEVEALDPVPESMSIYLRPDPREAAASELSSIVDAIRNRSGNGSGKLREAMTWVDENLTYDHSSASLSADPAAALRGRTGHCSDYHGLCSAVARRIGYPSRVAYGLQMFDKGSPSHCKLEVYLPPFGWVPFDLSETQKRAQKIQSDSTLSVAARQRAVDRLRRRTAGGFRENTWLKVTQGVNYELAPPASRPVPVVRTIYAEADGEPLPEPDPSDPTQTRFSWMTVHRVDAVSGTPKKFSFDSFDTATD